MTQTEAKPLNQQQDQQQQHQPQAPQEHFVWLTKLEDGVR